MLTKAKWQAFWYSEWGLVVWGVVALAAYCAVWLPLMAWVIDAQGGPMPVFIHRALITGVTIIVCGGILAIVGMFRAVAWSEHREDERRRERSQET